MNMQETTLVVMAAGMGSRFGGLKQMEPVDDAGRAILDYSIFDAKRAGFNRVVFIIKEAIAEAFISTVGQRSKKMLPTDFVYQELNSALPEGFSLPEGRQKPWGTGHAILCAAGVVNTPFAIINADDYYGPDAFMQMHEALVNEKAPCMVSYCLGNTLTENGTVARGICRVEDGLLQAIEEHTALDKNSGFPLDTPVSMNMWGFGTDAFVRLKVGFAAFLQNLENPAKQEYFLPAMVSEMLKEGKSVHVYQTDEKWYGVTYREDLASVVKALQKKREGGLYNGF